MLLQDLNVADKHEEGKWVDVVGPDGKETDVKILIVGPYSDTYRENQNQHYRNNTAEAARLMSVVDKGESETLQKELTGADFLRLRCVWSIKDWAGIDIDEDEQFECNQKNAFDLLKAAPYIQDQIFQEFRKLEGFTIG